MTSTISPQAVPGLAETRLTDAEYAALPSDGPGAPWSCRASALMWVQRADAPRFGWLARPSRFVLVAFVDYLDTPVGPYREVLAGAVLRDGRSPLLQVPFLAVDSASSVLGGRVNWGLPKTMAEFSGDLGRGAAQAVGDGWWIRARRAAAKVATAGAGAAVGRDALVRLPIRARFASIGPLGRYTTAMRSVGSPLLVDTAAEGETLTSWLGSGRHLGVLLSGRMQISAPTRTARQD